MIGKYLSTNASIVELRKTLTTQANLKRITAARNLTAVIIAVIVMSTSIVMMNNVVEPIEAAAVGPEDINTEKVDTSSYHANIRALPLSSMISTDFTTQGALSFTAARQTNNIVNTNTYYDIIIETSTAAAIKEIRVTFPAGTDVSIARLVEAEGIGKGTVGPGSISGQTVRYIVNNEEVTTIPAGTLIRLELSNIVNPSSPSTGYKVTVETRGTTNNIIDGPSQSFAYPIKQIGNADIANGAVTAGKVSPSFMQSKILNDGQSGWNPDATLGIDTFTITDSAVKASNSHVYISVDEPSDVGPLAVNVVCMVEDIVDNEFQVVCDLPPADGSVLRYTMINQP